MYLEKDKVPCTWATTKEIAALAGISYVYCGTLIRKCGIEKRGRIRLNRTLGPALFDSAEVLKAIAVLADAKKANESGWTPPLSEKMRCFSDASRGHRGCPALGIPCMMARNCSIGYDEDASDPQPQSCAEFCANRGASYGKISCRSCKRYMTPRCEFDCIRAAARKKIRLAFGDSQRSMAIPKEVYHA